MFIFALLAPQMEIYRVMLKYTKISKNPKFRTILSVIITPTYVLAKYFNFVLSLCTTDEYTVKNSFDPAKGIINCSHNLLYG